MILNTNAGMSHRLPNHLPRVPIRLVVFVIFSIALHGLLLLWSTTETTPPLSKATGAAYIQVALLDQKSEPTKPAPSGKSESAQQQTAITAKPRKTAATSAEPVKSTQIRFEETEVSSSKKSIPSKPEITQPVKRREITASISDISTREEIKPAALTHTGKEQNQPQESRSADKPTDTIAALSTTTPNSAARLKDSKPDVFSADTKNQTAFLLDEINRALSRYIVYPNRARRRGWEGEVLLAFNISHQGNINNIHISRSSGYSLLDNSAVAAMLKVKNISWRGREHLSSMLELELPILYRLKDG